MSPAPSGNLRLSTGHSMLQPSEPENPQYHLSWKLKDRFHASHLGRKSASHSASSRASRAAGASP